MVSTISSVDTNVYTKGKIKYTNQHEGIVKLSTFDGTLSEDKEKAEKARTLLVSLKDLKEEGTVSTLPKKDNGYYWVDVSVTTEDDFLVFSGEDEYNFDMYYDMEGQKVYVKEKYYDEFSSKNNKVKFTGYKSNDKLKGLIEELAGKKSAQ
jgi:hypothetical protein